MVNGSPVKGCDVVHFGFKLQQNLGLQITFPSADSNRIKLPYNNVSIEQTNHQTTACPVTITHNVTPCDSWRQNQANS
jgi:hypothetical protein